MPPIYVLPFSQQGCREEPSEAERTNYAAFDFMEFTELLSPKHFFIVVAFSVYFSQTSVEVPCRGAEGGAKRDGTCFLRQS